MERIEAAFDPLTPEQRDVVTLAHVVGLSRREIGERTGRSEGAVRVMLHRALARLSELVPDPWPGHSRGILMKSPGSMASSENGAGDSGPRTGALEHGRD